MGAWKCYAWERATWPEFRKVQVSYDQACKLIRKLCHHFKVQDISGEVEIKRSGATWSHYRESWGGSIKFSMPLSLGTVCHEFAHHLTAHRWGRRHGHDRKFKRELRRTYTWARRYLPVAAEPEKISVDNSVNYSVR